MKKNGNRHNRPSCMKSVKNLDLGLLGTTGGQIEERSIERDVKNGDGFALHATAT